ncbi:hypothetical protein E05_10940 [Plautia stali symbiont]|nr:hypothetical protein E05_10940 [Plautia stali symbiont]
MAKLCHFLQQCGGGHKAVGGKQQKRLVADVIRWRVRHSAKSAVRGIRLQLITQQWINGISRDARGLTGNRLSRMH